MRMCDVLKRLRYPKINCRCLEFSFRRSENVVDSIGLLLLLLRPGQR